jgi:nicotinate-nucleotide adenylyltransferase
MKNKKIALFGGSFNPIHNKHIKIIKNLIKGKVVDEVWIIPCKKHPFNKELLDTKHRIAMIKLAIKDIKKAKISYIEIKSKGKNYTIKTIEKLQNNHKNYIFYLIIGSDILNSIKKWYRYKELIKKIDFIVFKRYGYKIKNLKNLRIYKKIIDMPDNTSSTEIRKKIKDNKIISNLVPYSVEKYINHNNLYK